MEYSTDPLNLHPHELNAAIYGIDDLPAEFLDSVREFGVLTPLVVLEDGTIISGHRRWLAAKQLNHCSVPIRVIGMDDKLDIAEAVIEANRQREKTFSVRMREAEALRNIETERARLRLAVRSPLPTGSSPEVKGETRDVVAKQVGFGSGRTYDRARTVWDRAKSGDEAAAILVQRLDSGETTITAAFNLVKSPATKPPPPAEIAPGGWGVNPGEAVLHWWERDPELKALWDALVGLPDIIANAATDNLSDSEQEALGILIRGTIKELKRNWATC